MLSIVTYEKKDGIYYLKLKTDEKTMQFNSIETMNEHILNTINKIYPEMSERIKIDFIKFVELKFKLLSAKSEKEELELITEMQHLYKNWHEYHIFKGLC